MKRLIFCVLCCVLFAVPVSAKDKPEPLEPLDPIKQQDRSTLVLPGEKYRLIPNPDGGLLLLCGDRLAWLDTDGVTILREEKLPKHYTDLAPRDGYFLAVSRHHRTFEVLDAKTFKPRSTITLNTQALHRVVPHPKIPICYITTSDGDVPFLLYDELTGEMRQEEQWLGRDLIIDPTGSFMVSGFSRTVQVGERLHFNGPNILTTPEWDSIEALFRYHLDKSGMPTMAEFRDGTGGGMTGIVASPDARRVTFLSFAGFAGTRLAGWDALDFKKVPTSYGVKEGGSTKSLDYHPVLPMVGSPGKGGAVFFHSETGQQLEDRLAKPEELDAAITYDGLRFSPDGTHALLLHKVEYKDEEGKPIKPATRVLVAAPLTLSQAELAQIARGPAEIEPVELPDLPNEEPAAPKGEDIHAAMHKQTMKWIMDNSIFGPESELSSNVIRNSGKILDDKRGFWILLGGGLTKSGKYTVIAVHQGKFMTQELTEEQAKATGLRRMQSVTRPGIAFENEDPPRRVLSIESAAVESKADKMLEGKMILQKLGKIDRARFAVSFTFFEGDKVTRTLQHMGDWLQQERSEQNLKFRNPVADDDKPRLIIGFIQMEAFEISRRNDRRIPLSDPALLIAIHKPVAANDDAE